MVPAIYMDVSTDGANCNSTQTLTMSVEAFECSNNANDLRVHRDPR